jgi:replicative DNA helicase
MIKDYNYDVQKLYLELMLSDAEVFVRCQGIFDHTLFDRKLQDAAEFINTYAKEYTVLPDYEMVNASCRVDFKKPDVVKDGHMDWLMDEFESFTRHKAIERAIVASADLLEKHNYGEVETLIKEAVQIGLARDMGTNYFEDPRGRLMGLKDKNGQISTGWPCMDRKLFGGMNRGELNIFAGGSGAGKSLFLANLGVNWALMGLNVVYLTLELSEALVSMRIDSMVTGVSTKEIFRDLDDVEMKVKMIGKKSGMLQIKYMPSGKTVNDIRAYVKEYEIRCGKKVVVLLVDYMDLLMPIG